MTTIEYSIHLLDAGFMNFNSQKIGLKLKQNITLSHAPIHKKFIWLRVAIRLHCIKYFTNLKADGLNNSSGDMLLGCVTSETTESSPGISSPMRSKQSRKCRHKIDTICSVNLCIYILKIKQELDRKKTS